MASEISVLVVEDEALILIGIQATLEDGGFNVLAAYDATQAQTLIDADEPLAALVTDIRLGNGASGWEVARNARQQNPHIPIVYISGDSGDEWLVEGLPKSVMLRKPFAHAQLLTAIGTLLEDAIS